MAVSPLIRQLYDRRCVFVPQSKVKARVFGDCSEGQDRIFGEVSVRGDAASVHFFHDKGKDGSVVSVFGLPERFFVGPVYGNCGMFELGDVRVKIDGENMYAHMPAWDKLISLGGYAFVCYRRVTPTVGDRLAYAASRIFGR